MTKKTKTVWTTDSGEEFGSESEAQAHEINCIPGIEHCGENFDPGEWVTLHKDAILSILGAKRRTRSDKGKSRKAKEVKVAA